MGSEVFSDPIFYELKSEAPAYMWLGASETSIIPPYYFCRGVVFVIS